MGLRWGGVFNRWYQEKIVLKPVITETKIRATTPETGTPQKGKPGLHQYHTPTTRHTARSLPILFPLLYIEMPPTQAPLCV